MRKKKMLGKTLREVMVARREAREYAIAYDTRKYMRSTRADKRFGGSSSFYPSLHIFCEESRWNANA